MIDRRAFIGSLAIGALAEPRSVLAQSPSKIARIGLFNSGAPTSIMIGPEPKSWVTTHSCADCASSATCMASIS